MLVTTASVASFAAPAGAQEQSRAQPAATGLLAAPSQPPIVIDAGFSRVDYTTNTVVFRNIVVSQGDTRLTAARARATGVGFANSQWTFENGVVIDLVPRGTLRCDRAVVTFRDNRVTVATATGTSGKPANFEQGAANSQLAAHGSADRIVYDAKTHSVRLSGDARFADARGFEVSGSVLEYDIRGERLQAGSSGQGRGVHITVAPGALSHRRQSASRGSPRR